jgi:hypothetical protein
MDRMTWDRLTLAAAFPVAVVACIAAVISYGHIETLALSVHQSIDAARLLPFAVDFLIVAGSVVLLAGYWLGWLCVVSGVAATLFANVESGISHGALAATVAAWPAVAFTVASFVLERFLASRADTTVPVLVSVSGVPAEIPVPEPVSVPAEKPVLVPAGNGHDPELAPFVPEIASGAVPTIKVIRERASCGQPKAQEIQRRIRAMQAA